MADSKYRNRSAIASKYPEVAEALDDLNSASNNIAQQTNAAPIGSSPAPAPHAGLTVTGGSGIFDAAIDDNSPKYRGHSNFLEYSNDSSFSSAHVIHLGPSRNWRGSLGTGTYHFRSYSSYPTSAPSTPIYHPPVSGAGSVEPKVQAGRGSGTSKSAGYGFGHIPYNSTTPPKRG